jgi:hypothetical protein
MRQRLATLAVPFLVAALAAGCSNNDASEGAEGNGTPTASKSVNPEVPQSKGLLKIGIDGTPSSPITWRVPEGTTPTSPVGVTQRFLAMYGQAGIPDAEHDIELVSSITADAEYSLSAEGATTYNAIREGYTPGETRTGPLWIWLDEAQTRGDHAVVRGCADIGYFLPEGAKAPAKYPASAWYTELRRVTDFDGRTVWKVSRHNSGPIRESNEFEARCPAWAKHSPAS